VAQRCIQKKSETSGVTSYAASRPPPSFVCACVKAYMGTLVAFLLLRHLLDPLPSLSSLFVLPLWPPIRDTRADAHGSMRGVIHYVHHSSKRSKSRIKRHTPPTQSPFRTESSLSPSIYIKRAHTHTHVSVWCAFSLSYIFKHEHAFPWHHSCEVSVAASPVCVCVCVCVC
jgi:hypothetical protein